MVAEAGALTHASPLAAGFSVGSIAGERHSRDEAEAQAQLLRDLLAWREARAAKRSCARPGSPGIGRKGAVACTDSISVVGLKENAPCPARVLSAGVKGRAEKVATRTCRPASGACSPATVYGSAGSHEPAAVAKAALAPSAQCTESTPSAPLAEICQNSCASADDGTLHPRLRVAPSSSSASASIAPSHVPGTPQAPSALQCMLDAWSERHEVPRAPASSPVRRVALDPTRDVVDLLWLSEHESGLLQAALSAALAAAFPDAVISANGLSACAIVADGICGDEANCATGPCETQATVSAPFDTDAAAGTVTCAFTESIRIEGGEVTVVPEEEETADRELLHLEEYDNTQRNKAVSAETLTTSTGEDPYVSDENEFFEVNNVECDASGEQRYFSIGHGHEDEHDEDDVGAEMEAALAPESCSAVDDVSEAEAFRTEALDVCEEESLECKSILPDDMLALRARLLQHEIAWGEPVTLDNEDLLSRAHDIVLFSFFEKRDRAFMKFPSSFEQLIPVEEHPPELSVRGRRPVLPGRPDGASRRHGQRWA
eukprot:TRINITY_DN13961_c1_g6_i1.p1 TRINITY_DN13961_c1_g6~~TRINITY_DN13961_c1_g6_i1.p1  ORF type:complete len:546 (-),score=96.19 TRINITY_DN13961_c1_g6_i1:223-1860(-)